MAARELIEDENVLSVKKIKQLFNHFFRNGQRSLHVETIESWILHVDAKQRCFGMTAATYNATAPAARGAIKEAAVKKFIRRIDSHFQRRHDCIHNCDRPKLAVKKISAISTERTLEDLTFLVSRFHEALSAEFPQYLQRLGFSGVTRNRVL